MLYANYCVESGEWSVTNEPCSCKDPACIRFRINSPGDGRRIIVLAAAVQWAYRNSLYGNLSLKTLSDSFAEATGHPIET